MKISKYLHSCLLVEENDKTILIDPGNFTYNAKVLDINKITELNYLLITHEHPDHFYLPFVKEILQKFSNLEIITNQSIVTLLEKENIKATDEGNELIKVTSVNHERVFDKQPPQNVLFEIGNKFVDPGDSISFNTTKEILALPLVGPSWSTTQVVEKAVELKPKIIVPIHDWMWKEEFRKTMYPRLKEFFAEKNIEFKPLETGEIVEI